MNPLVAVVGAGAVGSRVSRHLLATDSTVHVAIRDPEPGVAERLVTQLGERAHVHSAAGLGEPSVAVLAGPAPHAHLARPFLSSGVGVVSVSDDLDDVQALVALESLARSHGVTLVVGAAASPGITGLLARHLAASLDEVDEIHVAMHGTGGPACARQHHQALGGTALGWHDGGWMERPAGSGRELCWFPDPLGAWDCYRAEMADPALLVRAFPGIARITARMSANRRDRLTARLPMLSPPHREGGLGGIRVEVRGSRDGGRVTLVAGVAQRTAIMAGLMAGVAATAVGSGEVTSGLVVAGEAGLPTAAWLHRLRDAGLSLSEFVGTEEKTAW